MTISQVPASMAAGVQVRTLLVCQLGAETSGVQRVVPARRRKNAYRRVDASPPLAVAVQLMVVPAGEDDGLPVVVRVIGATTCTVPGRTEAATPKPLAVGDVRESRTPMPIVQVPTSAAVGVQLRVLPDWKTRGEGSQLLVPASWWPSVYWTVPGTPPVELTVQVRVVP